MFKKILIEKSLYNAADAKTERAKKIIQFFPKAEVLEIESYENYFNKVFKPYLQKRDNLNLFLAEKKGQLIRKAPPAYGTLNEDHYFFIHAYNCIYECEYCYLQGYFNSPDLVLFLNHEEILQEMTAITQNHKGDTPLWFHAGEFSDSLALSHITQEIPLYWDFFSQHKNT
jgi:spore photoproduct lyase